MIMRDMLSAGIAIYDEDPEMYRLAAHRFFAGLLPVRNWWYPGHGFHQGSAYNETRWVSDMFPLWIFDRLGAGNVYHPAQQFVPYEWIYRRRPDRQLLRSGDGYRRSPRLGALLTASYYGDGYLLANYLVDPGIDDTNKIWELLWRDPDLEARDFSDLPLSRYMGSPYGWMLARTGWTGEPVIAEMKVNVYNFINHQHLDAGTFQIYHKGPLAIDSGLYQGSTGGYGSPHDDSYNKRTIAHNSLLIYDPDEKFISGSGSERRNDGGQRLPNSWREAGLLADVLTRGYETGEVLGYGFGPDPHTPRYTYLKGDITKAYGAKVRQAQRSFVFLNLYEPAVPAAMVVFDRVVSSNPAFKKYWLLHTMEEPSIEGDRSVVALSERGWTGKLVNTTLLPPSAEIAKIGGPGKEFWVFGENFPNEPTSGNPLDYELGAWRLEISPPAEAETDLFLNVMQVTDTSSSAVHAVDKIEGKDVVGVQLAGRVALFSSTGRRLERPVSFTAKGEGDLEFLVTDLAGGTWQVRRDGRVLHPARVVTHDAGTLYFKGPAGEYSLRR
jgi:heparin/heparan-sulfate lyase